LPDTGVLVSVPVISSDAAGAEGCLAVDYTDRLRHLAINDARFAEDRLCGAGVDSGELDPKTLQLVRLAALITVGALFRPTEPRPMPRSTRAPRPLRSSTC
jgi:hypothetical protein